MTHTAHTVRRLTPVFAIAIIALIFAFWDAPVHWEIYERHYDPGENVAEITLFAEGYWK